MRIAGIDIGGTSIKTGVLDDGKLIMKSSRFTPHSDPQRVCDLIAEMLDGQHVDMAGVGAAGSVECSSIVSASNLGWERVPLAQMLQDRLHIPVFIDNDAQAALMSEWHDGVCKGAQCAVYLTLGTGIGGAMIVDGKPYRGRYHLGAEFGHMIIRPNGPRCACGRRGCLEYYASATGLKRLASGRLPHELILSAKAGDEASVQIFDEYVHMLCIGLNNLIMALDPEVIALGGGLSCAGDFLAECCRRELRRIFDETTDPLNCRVMIAKHQNDAGILGAALLAEQNLSI